MSMDRRNFLSGGFSALLCALVPWRTEEKQTPSLVAKGFAVDEVLEQETLTSYAVERGVLIWGDHKDQPGCLFEDLCFTFMTRQDSSHVRVDGMVAKVVGPEAVMKAAYEQFGDVMNTKNNTLRLGLLKEDKKTLWIKLPQVVLTSIGMSVLGKVVKEGIEQPQNLIVTEWINFIGAGEPLIECGPQPGKSTSALGLHQFTQTR